MIHKKIIILVVDDHPIFLKGLIEVLQTEIPESIIIAENLSSKALDLQDVVPDIAILDLDMPIMNGIVLGESLKIKYPAIKLIILTMHKESDIIRFVISKGFDGYVFKDDAVNDLVFAIEKVLSGDNFIPNQFNIEENADEKLFQLLTKTEIVVLKGISENKTSKEIAENLFVSTKTIDNHRNNISKKLNLQGSNSLLKFVVNHKNYFR